MTDELTKTRVIAEYFIGKERLNALINDGALSTRTGTPVGHRSAPVLVSRTDLEALGIKRRDTPLPGPSPRYLEQHVAALADELRECRQAQAEAMTVMSRLADGLDALAARLPEPGATEAELSQFIEVCKTARRTIARLLGAYRQKVSSAAVRRVP